MKTRTEIWFIAGNDGFQKKDDWKEGKFLKRVCKWTPWKEIDNYGRVAWSSECLDSQYTEISREEYLNHKCIDCWHPNGKDRVMVAVK